MNQCPYRYDLCLCLSLLYTDLCLTVALPELEVTSVMHLLGRRECLTVKLKRLDSCVSLRYNRPNLFVLFLHMKIVHYFLYDPEKRLAIGKDATAASFPFPGVFLWENFISEEEEEELINTMDEDVWTESQSGRRKQVMWITCCFVCFSWICIWFSRVILSHYKRTFQESKGVGCWFDTVFLLYQLNLQNNWFPA